MPHSSPEEAPLLELLLDDIRTSNIAVHGFIGRHVRPPVRRGGGISRWRSSARRFLSSKWGHYIILVLVAVDVACIFADFLIQLHNCEVKHSTKGWDIAQDILSLVSLVFSCLFLVELAVSLLSFGSSYLSSKFHIFDSLVIVAGFVIDVTTHGTEEELGSLVIVLRLWRVIQIIEELSAASEDALDRYWEEIEKLKRENRRLRQGQDSDAIEGQESISPSFGDA
ncbi:hypothetical protein V1505DRAFT_379635 [Lipomyces doorenjongii]